MYLMLRNPTCTVLVITVPAGMRFALKTKKILINDLSLLLVSLYLSLLASLLFGSKLISLLLSSVNISKSYANAMQNAHLNWISCKGSNIP